MTLAWHIIMPARLKIDQEEKDNYFLRGFCQPLKMSLQGNAPSLRPLDPTKKCIERHAVKIT